MSNLIGPARHALRRGLAFGVSAALLAPHAVLAAEPVAIPQRDNVVVFIVVALLVGSVTAGLLFASPLHGRGGGAATVAGPTWGGQRGTRSRLGRLVDGVPAALAGDIFDRQPGMDVGPAVAGRGQHSTPQYATAPPGAQATSGAQATPDVQSPAGAQPSPLLPWSTSPPQAGRQWRDRDPDGV